MLKALRNSVGGVLLINLPGFWNFWAWIKEPACCPQAWLKGCAAGVFHLVS